MTVYTIFEIVGFAALVLGFIRYFTNKPSNILVTYLQDFIGVFFIFSGFVKAVDPLGTSYKMHEYFEAFSQEGFAPLWDWMAGFSTFFAIVMIAAELFIGFMLLIGWKPKLTIAVIWLLTLFFTFLTGYTYLSGYCISKLFLLSSAVMFLLFAGLVIPAKPFTRSNLLYVALGLLVLLYAFGKLSGHLLQCGFDETKMKVTDCGCFGDFIKLKPWQTFYKDIILDFIIFVLLWNTGKIQPLFGNAARNGISLFAGVASLFFCVYSTYWNEPVIDFRPYKIGNNIPDLRIVKVPEKLEMQWQYHNKTTGKWEVITYDQVMKNQVDYSKYDTSYRQDKMLDPGIPAKITNLRIENDDNQDMTDTIFADPNYSLMVVSYNLDITHTDAFKDLNAIAAGCDKAGVKFYAVVANNGHMEEFRHKNQTAYPFYHADETPLKTIIRSNPGLVLFKNGTVINKWHYRHLPTFEQLNSEYFSKH